MVAFSIFLITSAFTCAFAGYVSDQTVLSTRYDYIVVGGGTAGSVVANRLSEDPHKKVLIIEAGPTQDGVIESAVPFLCSKISLPSSVWDWNYTVTPQIGYNNRSFPYARGKLLGGSSATNFMIYNRGSVDDWNKYANTTGNPHMNWRKIKAYFAKNEKWTEPYDHHNITGQYDPSVHSTDGVTSISLAGYKTPITDRVINATHQLGGDFAFRQDMNGGHMLGIGYTQFTIDGKHRSSAATSYLAPKYLTRSNLHILVNTQVSRLLPTNVSTERVPDVRIVEWRSNSTRMIHTITAHKEIILSGGAIGTPSILQNSGIGNATELNALSISVVANLPWVGANLQDHPAQQNYFSVKGTNTLENYWRNTTYQQELLGTWKDNGVSNLLWTSYAGFVGWVRLNSSNPIFKLGPDPTAGPHTPHYELVIGNGIPYGPPATGHFMTVPSVVLHPVSRGTVKINSTDPFEPPLIDPGFMTNPFDRVMMREAMKGARRFVQAPAWADYVIDPYNAPGWNGTDDEFDAYITANAVGIHHPFSTAKMSPFCDDEGVVNPDFKVKNITGLRIVDASIFPEMPSGHPVSVVYAMSELAADTIREVVNMK